MDTKRAMVAFGVAKNRLGLCGALALLLSSSSIAQTAFPSKPITVMVGFAPGGSLDTVARIVSKRLGDNLGQPIIVENRPGAGGSIVMNYIARTAPDGYTITLANVGSIAVNPHLLKVVYDPLVDFTPIAKAVVFPDVIVAPPQAPARTLAEFVKLAKEKSGSITYGSSGVGSAAHLAGTLLEMDADIKLVHVPYQGGAPAMRALLAGEIDSYFAAPVTVAPHIKSGKAIPIAVTGAKRMR